jgi:hypothetical protein
MSIRTSSSFSKLFLLVLVAAATRGEVSHVQDPANDLNLGSHVSPFSALNDPSILSTVGFLYDGIIRL